MSGGESSAFSPHNICCSDWLAVNLLIMWCVFQITVSSPSLYLLIILSGASIATRFVKVHPSLIIRKYLAALTPHDLSIPSSNKPPSQVNCRLGRRPNFFFFFLKSVWSALRCFFSPHFSLNPSCMKFSFSPVLISNFQHFALFNDLSMVPFAAVKLLLWKHFTILLLHCKKINKKSFE